MRRADRERVAKAQEGKPRCAECGRVIVYGSALNGYWLCEYCEIVQEWEAP